MKARGLWERCWVDEMLVYGIWFMVYGLWFIVDGGLYPSTVNCQLSTVNRQLSTSVIKAAAATAAVSERRRFSPNSTAVNPASIA